MKTYVKPEIETVDFEVETVMTGDNMDGGVTSSNVVNPWGP